MLSSYAETFKFSASLRCYRGKLLEIHRNERCEEVSSREWEQIHEKSASQTGGWCMELEEVWMLKSVKLL